MRGRRLVLVVFVVVLLTLACIGETTTPEPTEPTVAPTTSSPTTTMPPQTTLPLEMTVPPTTLPPTTEPPIITTVPPTTIPPTEPPINDVRTLAVKKYGITDAEILNELDKLEYNNQSQTFVKALAGMYPVDML